MQGYTYSELEQALQDWTDNTSSDTGEFVDNIPRLVQNAELRCVRDLNLEIFDVTNKTTSVVTSGSRFVPKPAGLVAARRLMLNISGSITRLTLRSNDWLANYNPTPAVGVIPKFYAEYNDTQWEIAATPSSNGVVESRGVYRPASLVDEESTWLGDNCGDLILNAALLESEKFLKADDRMEDYSKEYERLLAVARLELGTLVRRGQYAPYLPAAFKAG